MMSDINRKGKQHRYMLKRLLILGAGGHGRVAAEIAESLGYSVSFLDDKLGEGVIGSISELEKFGSEFDSFFIGIGNNAVRHKLQDRLTELGLTVTILISPRAYVSPSVKVGWGTVIEPGAIVNANVTIGFGCIVSVGSIIDHDSVLEDFSHVNTGAICMSGAHVAAEQKVEAGEIVHGFY